MFISSLQENTLEWFASLAVTGSAVKGRAESPEAERSVWIISALDFA